MEIEMKGTKICSRPVTHLPNEEEISEVMKENVLKRQKAGPTVACQTQEHGRVDTTIRAEEIKWSAIATALLLLAKGAEELELITIADILARSKVLFLSILNLLKVNVVIAGISGKEVVLCSRGVKIQPDASLAEVQDQDFDAIILPGGLEGTKNLSKVGLSHV
ncbi:Protein deglycase DJ-1zDJ-1 [Sparganum proliferum]